MNVFLFALWLGIPVFASDQIPDVDMHAMTKEVMALQRYMFSDAEFGASKNEAAIQGSFPILEKHLARLKSKVFTDQPALRMNASMLWDQISDADQAFKRGDKAYARYVLVSSLQLCVACHTRTASADFALPESEMKGADILDRANYFFATRQFDQGRVLYEQFLAKPQKRQAPGLVRSASLALAIYYARVKGDAKGGHEYFTRLANQKNHSLAQRKKFREWASAFGEWAGRTGIEEQAISDREAMDQARQLLKQKSGTSADEIRSLRASALLHTVLEAPGETSPRKAEALLELGKIYETLDLPIYYRFGDMYLKACISDYKKSKAAENCYQALDSFVKQRIRFGSEGSAASLEEAELLNWKKLAY